MKPAAALLGLAILTFAPAIARADYCMRNPEAQEWVGKGFVVPAKGECKPWTGFTSWLGQNSPTTGTGCMSSDGSHLNFTLFTSFPENNGFIEIDSIPLSMPSALGVNNPTYISGGIPGAGVGFNMVGAKCGKPTVTIPDGDSSASPTP